MNQKSTIYKIRPMGKASRSFLILVLIVNLPLYSDVIKLIDGEILLGKIQMVDEENFTIDNNEKLTRVKKKEILKIYVYEQSNSNVCLKELGQDENCNYFLNYLDKNNLLYIYDIQNDRYKITRLEDLSFVQLKMGNSLSRKISLPNSKIAIIKLNDSKTIQGEIISSDESMIKIKNGDEVNSIEVDTIQSIKFGQSNNQDFSLNKIDYINYLLPGVYEWNNDQKVLGSFLGIMAVTSSFLAYSSYTKGINALEKQEEFNTIGLVGQQYYLVDPGFQSYNKYKRQNHFALASLGITYLIHSYILFSKPDISMSQNEAPFFQFHFSPPLENSPKSSLFQAEIQFNLNF